MPDRLRPDCRAGLARGSSGFTLLELIVVVCVVSVMAGILLNRMQLYQEAAEKAGMQQTAAAIKSALQMRVAAYLISGRDNQIEHLLVENPVAWLQEKPAEYAGEFHADAYTRVAPGSWYFDRAQHEFVYVVRLGAHFKAGADGRKWVRYRVKIEYDEMPDRNGTPRRVLSAVNFLPVQPYTWLQGE